MAYYRSVGEVPHTRHTALRDEAGDLRYEELMGEEGFSSDSSLLYHAGVPSAIVDSQVWELPDQARLANHPLKPRHLDRMRNLIFHVSGLGAGPDGVREHEGGIKSNLLHESHRVLVLLIGFAGKPQANSSENMSR